MSVDHRQITIWLRTRPMFAGNKLRHVSHFRRFTVVCISFFRLNFSWNFSIHRFIFDCKVLFTSLRKMFGLLFFIVSFNEPLGRDCPSKKSANFIFKQFNAPNSVYVLSYRELCFNYSDRACCSDITSWYFSSFVRSMDQFYVAPHYLPLFVFSFGQTENGIHLDGYKSAAKRIKIQ